MKLFTINDRILFYHEYVTSVDTGIIYKPLKFDWQKAMRFLHMKLKLPFFSIWYSKEFRNFITKDVIIIFDSVLTIQAANYIKRKNPNARVIYWFWNHIYIPSDLQYINPTIEKWSYDYEDCEKYELKYNTQFYFKSLLQTPFDSKEIMDFFFVGADKGRKDKLIELEELLKRYNLKYTFSITGSKRQESIKKWMPYDVVIDNILHSKCIVDIVPPEQKGLTLRPLEALFFQKKLLTNFVEIQESEFYNRNNIFIWGIDDETQIVDFVNSPYDETVNIYIDKYDFKNWLNRFY